MWQKNFCRKIFFVFLLRTLRDIPKSLSLCERNERNLLTLYFIITFYGNIRFKQVRYYRCC